VAPQRISLTDEIGSSITDPKKRNTVSLGDNGECEVIGQGTALIERLIDGVWHEARIENVLYVPKIRKNLFSIGEYTEKGFKAVFEKKWTKVQDDGEIVAIGVKQTNKIFRMFFRTQVIASGKEANVSIMSLRLWHERLEHVNARVLKELINEEWTVSKCQARAISFVTRVN